MAVAMNVVARWHCRKCLKSVDSRYCPDCGEAQIKPADLSFRHLLGEAYRAVSSVDSKLLRTFRALMFRPGSLSLAYVSGPRKPFIAPFQLFLLANVAFFAVQSWASIKVFSTPLASHLHHQDWSELAQRWVNAKLAQGSLTLAEYAPVFDRAAATNAKSMVILMAIPFALLLMLLFGRKDRPLVTHLVFALHFYAFELMILSILLLITIFDTWVGGPNPNSSMVDVSLFAAQLITAGLYLFLATSRAYAVRGWRRALSVATLVLAVGAGLLLYRFTVFLITLLTT
ncbi:MAG: DUF3667 domain-containing protein [Povalibacter sp.]